MTTESTRFELSNEGGDLIIHAPAHLDAAAQPQFTDALKAVEETAGTVSINLSRTTFMDSAGVGFIVSVNRACEDRGVKLSISGAQDQPRKLLAALNIDRHIDIID